MGETGIKVGELARRSGLTVRTLHHYHDLGLLSPARRTVSGHRLYGEAEVRRLQQILSLRGLGLPLLEIRRWLEAPGVTLAEVLRIQVERMRQRLASEQALLVRLEHLVNRLSGDGGVSTEEILDTMEAMTMYEKYYTPEQLEKLAERREELGEERIREAEEEWRRIFTTLSEARSAGLDPESSEMVAVGRRALELIEAFTGGDPGIRGSLETMYREEGTAPAARHGITDDPEVWGYLSRVMEAARQS